MLIKKLVLGALLGACIGLLIGTIQDIVMAGNGCLAVMDNQQLYADVDYHNNKFKVTCGSDDEWKSDTPPADELSFAPNGDEYALGEETVDMEGWTRIREGVAKGDYFSWNFLTMLQTDREVLPGEIAWVKPILLQIAPEDDPITVLIQIKRDTASSTNWKSEGYEMDPYDSSLSGQNGQRQGETLIWLYGGQALVKVNETPNFILDTEPCLDCTAPTSLTIEQISPTTVDEHITTWQPFLRDSDEVISWLVTVQPGQVFLLWEGILVEDLN